MVPLGGTVVAATAWLTAQPITKVSGRRRQAEADDASLATDVAQGSRVVKGLGAVEVTTARFSQVTENALIILLRGRRIHGVVALV